MKIGGEQKHQEIPIPSKVVNPVTFSTNSAKQGATNLQGDDKLVLRDLARNQIKRML